MGNPLRVKPQGTEIAGSPVSVIAVHQVEPLGVVVKGSAVDFGRIRLSTGKGCTATMGSTSKSLVAMNCARAARVPFVRASLRATSRVVSS